MLHHLDQEKLINQNPEFSAHKLTERSPRTRWLKGLDHKSNKEPSSVRPPSAATTKSYMRVTQHTKTRHSLLFAAPPQRLIASYVSRIDHTHTMIHIQLAYQLTELYQGFRGIQSPSQTLHPPHHENEISAGMLFDKINDFNLQIWTRTAGREQ